MKTKGLTIQEAIKSGLPFKRLTHNCWTQHGSVHKHTGYLYSFSMEDVLAEDWEIKVPEVPITREKLAEKWNNYQDKHDRTVKIIDAECSPHFLHICKELGI